MKKKQSMRFGERKGAVIIVVLFLTIIASLIGGSVLKYSMNERKINRRHFLRLEAKNAAEAVVEYGFAELVSRFESRSSLPTNELQTNPLSLPASTSSLFTYGTSGTHCNVNPASMAMFGTMVNVSREYIDPTDPANEFDPMKGKTMDLYEVTVYGSATATDPLGPPITTYASQRIQARDAPLFTHAIFYNIPMEIAPGPTMDVIGPVHSNNEMYIQAGSGLNFRDVVTSAAGMHHGPLPGIGKSTSNADVTFRDGSANQVSMNDGSDWLNSGMDEWRATASQRWDGYVQSSSHGVQKHNAIGTTDYVPDDPDTAANELQNPAHDLIEPPDSAAAGTTTENEKLANKAGLYVYVDTATQNVTLFKDATARNAYFASGDTSGVVTYVDDPARPLISTTAIDYDSSVTNVDGSAYAETEHLQMIYDQRWEKFVDMYSVDVGVLREAVHGTGTGFGNYNEASKTESSPGDWNGIVYVEMSSPGISQGDSNRAPAIRLHNGKKIPNRQEIDAGGVDGFSLVTNGALYVQGHFNADGSISAASATTPDSGESPAALMADAINILSTDWDDDDSFDGVNDRTADPTEISAAILTGNVPSDPNRSGSQRYSGGVENFPRFLEKWTGVDFAYRGSMVALFESEVAKGAWGKSNVYSPPIRNWGFNSLFGAGNRRFPPGTPSTRSYRRVDYHELNQTAFAAALATMVPSP
ncbi:MAG: hypothetical protein DRP71_09205 [Verrucomicrobia bacterium]|nr:MAG: hypothetical protein DRP71_09205 [Verrucomicrobiota bacterium]